MGGKAKLAVEIISRMPDHKVYVELFGGAAHVMAQKSPSAHEIYNDIDGHLVNFLLVARADPEKLRQACETLPYSRWLYETWRDEWKAGKWPADPFERAVRWFYLNRSAIAKGNSPKNKNTGWRHSTTSKENPARSYQTACQRIESFAKRMRPVLIENLDFRKVIEKYDSPDTLFYCDPPYFDCEHYYMGEFSERDHRDLAEMLKQIKGKAIVSYYDHPMVYRLYDGWRIETFDTHKQVITNKSTADNRAREVLLMNYDLQMSLFEFASGGEVSGTA
ncbi:DNA adenine methylase [Lihuaxuella thermophila]|nr:DNA adenine methylase [Lihuaxuella thermophila]